MFDAGYVTTVGIVFFVAAVCVFIQRSFKKYLESDQYNYLKDITMVAAWALCGIWAPDGPLRVTIAAGIVAACIGFCQKVSKGKNLRFLYFLVGLGFSFFGPRIAFIEFTKGEYFYLSYFVSIAISTMWIGFFTLFFQELDEIPGVCGLMLAVTWFMISALILSSSHNLRDASQICIAGMVFILVFWNRLIHPYRRLTEPLTALWGTLFAGISIFGVSKGITFYAMAFIPLAFFAIPLFETLLGVVSAAFSSNPTGNHICYRQLLKAGKDHVQSILIVVRICSILGVITALFQFNIAVFLSVLVSVVIVVFAAHIFFKIKYNALSKPMDRHPSLWGIKLDNISLNYALTQAQHWIVSGQTAKMIVTPDALAALRSRTDNRYRGIVKRAGLVLPDGAGLTAALKLLGTPVQERIPGVEFTEHLCSRAAYEGWGVWLLGGEPGIAEVAAEKLVAKYPDLIISGTSDGYFKENETEHICSEIARSGAKILFVGLGVPKQEYRMEDHLADTGVCVGMGIGGTMDVISGKLTRAPVFWQKICMEWLYRTLQEPWRWRRITKLPVFVFYVFLTLAHIDVYKNEDVSAVK